MSVQLELVARTRRTSFVLLPLLLMSFLSILTPAAYAGPKPPVDPDPPVSVATVGDWCRLTAFTPYAENGVWKGKSNFSCSGNTNIREYKTELYNTAPVTAGGGYSPAVLYQAFTANGGVTYYAIPQMACPQDGISTSRFQVGTRLRYVDPRDNQSYLIETTGPWTGQVC